MLWYVQANIVIHDKNWKVSRQVPAFILDCHEVDVIAKATDIVTSAKSDKFLLLKSLILLQSDCQRVFCLLSQP